MTKACLTENVCPRTCGQKNKKPHYGISVGMNSLILGILRRDPYKEVLYRHFHLENALK